jgi:hypothetical protein
MLDLFPCLFNGIAFTPGILFYKKLSECPQCYCGDIRQMLTFLINLYCPKFYHRSDHLIRIVEYRRRKLLLFLNPSSPRLEPRTVFRCCGLSFCNLLVEIINFVLGVVLLSCLVSEPQEPPSAGLELRTHFPEFWPSYVLFLVWTNKHAKFGANQYIRSRAISKHT